MANTRTERHPEKYHCVTEWGFTHLTWPEFVKRFPSEAMIFAENYTEGWSPEEIAQSGGPDVTTWPALYDDVCFLDRKGRPTFLCNITGCGGAFWCAIINGVWDEVLYDEDGNREGDPEYEDE